MHSNLGLLLLKVEQLVVVVGAELARLELFHYPLVVRGFLRSAFPEAGLPVAIRRRPEHEVVVVVETGLEAKFANLDVLTNYALVLRVKNDVSFAAHAGEGPFVLLWLNCRAGGLVCVRIFLAHLICQLRSLLLFGYICFFFAKISSILV